jgi:uncharacterized membrane protein YecN with MAPEG domain
VIPVIVPAYTAVLAFLYIFLSVRVIRSRVTERVKIGTGGNRMVERRMRIHANFAEYVPLAIILLVFMEMQGRPSWWLHLLCILLVLARIGHTIALWKDEEIFPLRVATVFVTFVIIAAGSVSALARGLQLW